MVFDKNKSLIENLQNAEFEKPKRKKKGKTSNLVRTMITFTPKGNAFIRKNKEALIMAAESDLVYLKLCRKGQPDQVIKLDMDFEK